MRVEIKWNVDMWQEIKDDALFTIHKENGKYPDTKWKQEMLIAEHSPIRTGRLIINVYDVPNFVIGHLVRHNIGFTPFVSSLRSDRADYDIVPDRNTPNNIRFDGNFQSFINISRKRMCKTASAETVLVWLAILQEIKKVEPELYNSCVPECVYRCGCSEKYQCKDRFFNKLLKYADETNKHYLLFNIEDRYNLYHEMIERENV